MGLDPARSSAIPREVAAPPLVLDPAGRAALNGAAPARRGLPERVEPNALAAPAGPGGRDLAPLERYGDEARW